MFIIILLLSIIFIGCLIWSLVEGEFFVGSMIFLSLSLASLALALLIGGLIGHNLPQKEVYERIELTSLVDDSSVEGKFYLLGGQINGVDYYHYIEQRNGYKIKGKIKSDGVKIFEDGGNYLKICRKEFVNPDWENWGATIWDTRCPSEIHIPKNSITTEFNIDLN